MASQQLPSAQVLDTNKQFQPRVKDVKANIDTLTSNIGKISTLHQRLLSSPDSNSSRELEALVAQTQALNVAIKDEIKFLEADAARSRGNSIKNTQVGHLKNSFQKQLAAYRKVEQDYEGQNLEVIKRQYRIVNPDATDAEVEEAAQADWSNEGVFQTALKSSRNADVRTVLGSVAARHNDIQKIERTMVELQQLMEELATAVVVQEFAVQATDESAAQVKEDVEQGNTQLERGVKSARNARKLKWWCFWICVAIVIILALILGLVLGLQKAAS